MKDVKWPGRFDVVSHSPLFIIDGGHNPQCIEALVKNAEDYLHDRKVIALTGVLADKDYADMYVPIMPFVNQFVCITPPNPRKLEGMELAKYLRDKGADAVGSETIEDGVKMALEIAGDDGVILALARYTPLAPFGMPILRLASSNTAKALPSEGELFKL